MMVIERTTTALCPDCDYEIYLGSQPQKGQNLTCPECWAYLEVVNLEPLILNWDAFVVTDEDDYSYA